MSPGFYTHPAFLDVIFYLHKSFYIKEKALWECKVTWFHKRGYEIANDKFRVTNTKLKEFRRS